MINRRNHIFQVLFNKKEGMTNKLNNFIKNSLICHQNGDLIFIKNKEDNNNKMQIILKILMLIIIMIFNSLHHN
jgi:hypothetical protein